jgi:DNA transformation protein
MQTLQDLPNIGKTISGKLEKIGITSVGELITLGSKNAIIKISTLEDGGACLNMLYALEGAVQGIRWHGLDSNTKQELKEFYVSNLSQK